MSSLWNEKCFTKKCKHTEEKNFEEETFLLNAVME